MSEKPRVAIVSVEHGDCRAVFLDGAYIFGVDRGLHTFGTNLIEEAAESLATLKGATIARIDASHLVRATVWADDPEREWSWTELGMRLEREIFSPEVDDEGPGPN